MAYLKRKLGEWYREAPRPAREQPVVMLTTPHQPPTTITPRKQQRQTPLLVEAMAVGW
jgi:hypothetical protein